MAIMKRLDRLSHSMHLFFINSIKGEKMVSHPQSGNAVRELSMLIVMDFMQATPACQPNGGGMKQAVLFRDCGFDWGAQPGYASSGQQMWFGALLQVLKQNGKIQQLSNDNWELL